jgi:hypothetical protein
MEWQPIETAPKDLEDVLVGYWDTVNFTKDTWVSFVAAYQRIDFDEEEGQPPTLGWMPIGNGGDGKEYQIFPTHWMPLPLPPKPPVSST